MPVDQFGGVALDDEPSDEFGGVLISEEFTPPEREDYVSPPSFVVKPEVLVEGRTVERLPASFEVPEPARVVAPFNVEEFSRGDVATPEQRAFTAEQPSEFDRPVIPPGVFKTALDIGTMTMPRTELMEGFKEGTAEQLAGMTSQASGAMLPAFMAPYVGPALAMGMGAKALGAGAGKTVAGIESGDMREVGAGASEVIGGGLMVAGGGVAARARPAIPPRIVEAIAKGDAVGLTKATQTLADVVREQPKQEVTSAEAIRSDPGQVREAGRQPEVVQDQSRQALQQPAPEPAQPVGAQAGQSAEVLLTGPEVIKSIVELPDAEAGALRQKPAVEAGMKLTEADVPALEAARDKAGADMLTELEAGNDVAFKSHYGRNIWFSGAIEGARRKGPNYDAYLSEQAKSETAKTVSQPTETAPTTPTPPEAVSRGPVSDQPVGQPAVGAAEVPAQAFFERESEAAGLGRSSLPPTVEDVRASRSAVQPVEQPARLVDTPEGKRQVGRNLETWNTNFTPEEAARIRSQATPLVFSEKRMAQLVKGEPLSEGEIGLLKSGQYSVPPELLKARPDLFPEPAPFRKRGPTETLAEYTTAKREALGDTRPPYEQSIEEIQQITEQSRVLMNKAKAENNEAAYTFHRAGVLKGEEWIKYQRDNPRQKLEAPVAFAKTVMQKPSPIVRVDANSLFKDRGNDFSAGRMMRDQFGDDWKTGKYIFVKDYGLELRIDKPERNHPSDIQHARDVAELVKQNKPLDFNQTKQIQSFFNRQSEAQGLGELSTPPTVQDVRAQRAADTRQRAADAAAESGYVPDTRGETVKMRKSAERAVESPQIPEPVQERIEAAPESRYTQQSMARVDDAVKTMSDADLAATPADSNLYVASKLEQADRRFRAGDNDGGYAIFVELEKQGTSFGQNINQFKRLAGTRPEYVATVIDKHLTKAGKDALTPEQRATAIETTRKSKDADLALDKATDAWTTKPTAENARKAEAALDKANAEAIELQKFVAKFQPRGFWSLLKSILQGSLLTPISETANLFGNMSFAPWRAGERTTAAGIDMIDATLRNRPREIVVQPLVGTLEAIKGAGRGLKKVPDILIEGTGNAIKGETRTGLHPIKAWINQFAKNPEMPTTGGKLTLQDRLNLAIEGTFGIPAEAMLRGLGAGDAPFKEAARARSTATQLKLKNVPRGQWPFAQKFPELFLDKPALEQIGKDTATAVFQRESKTLNVITNWLRGKGEIVDFLAATVAPYKLTPWNIIGEIMSYNPLIAMTRGAIDAKKGNTRAAKLNAGKMVVGSMLTGAGVWLYNKGLLAPSLDERNEAQKGRVLAGEVLPPNHINISGLTRALKPGAPPDAAHFRPGDETADIMRGGGLAGSIFYMTANIGRDFERQPEVDQSDMWLSILRQSTLEQARFGMNQSFLSGVEGLLTAIKDGNSDNYVRQWANTVASIPLPNTLNTISRASREYKPDVSKDFPAQIKSKLGVFGLDDYLPLKRDFWGEPMRETPEGRNAIFYHFFDISKNKQVTSNPVELELYRLWRKTANSEVIPSIPTRKLTIENQEYPLTPNLYEKYAEVVGRNRREIVDAMVINPNFHELTDEQKIDVLERAYRDGLARGKALFYQEHQGALVPKAGRAGFTP